MKRIWVMRLICGFLWPTWNTPQNPVDTATWDKTSCSIYSNNCSCRQLEQAAKQPWTWNNLHQPTPSGKPSQTLQCTPATALPELSSHLLLWLSVSSCSQCFVLFLTLLKNICLSMLLTLVWSLRSPPCCLLFHPPYFYPLTLVVYCIESFSIVWRCHQLFLYCFVLLCSPVCSLLVLIVLCTLRFVVLTVYSLLATTCLYRVWYISWRSVVIYCISDICCLSLSFMLMPYISFISVILIMSQFYLFSLYSFPMPVKALTDWRDRMDILHANCF